MEDMKIYIFNPNRNVYIPSPNKDIPDGGWFNLPITEDEVNERLDINVSLEELEIRVDSLPFIVSDDITITELNDIYRQIETLEPAIQNAISGLMKHFSTIQELCDNTDSIIHYKDCSSMRDVAEEMVKNHSFLGELSVMALLYIDYHKLAEDLRDTGTFVITSHGIFEIQS